MIHEYNWWQGNNPCSAAGSMILADTAAMEEGPHAEGQETCQQHSSGTWGPTQVSRGKGPLGTGRKKQKRKSRARSR